MSRSSKWECICWIKRRQVYKYLNNYQQLWNSPLAIKRPSLLGLTAWASGRIANMMTVLGHWTPAKSKSRATDWILLLQLKMSSLTVVAWMGPNQRKIEWLWNSYLERPKMKARQDAKRFLSRGRTIRARTGNEARQRPKAATFRRNTALLRESTSQRTWIAKNIKQEKNETLKHRWRARGESIFLIKRKKPTCYRILIKARKWLTRSRIIREYRRPKAIDPEN